MTGTQAPPAHRTLAADLRFLRAGLTELPQNSARLLDDAIRRAEHEHTQAQIWHGEAQQRETAEALIERLRAELARLTRIHADHGGPLDQYADGARHVIDQITQALGEP